MSRAAVAILSTENLLHNLSVIQKAAPASKITAMVKANAYGHGLRSTALRLDPYVSSLGVSSIDEALSLRKAGVKSPIILIEGVFEPDELLVASCQNFEVVFHEERQLKWLQQQSLPLPLKVWLKIDTGMSRLGFFPEEAKAVYEILSNSPNVIQPVNILSHFACADLPDHSLNQQQINVFEAFIQELDSTLSSPASVRCAGGEILQPLPRARSMRRGEGVQGFPGLKSLANSPGLFQFPQAHYDLVRIGISLYGVSPFAGISAEQLGLKPVMTLQTRLIAVRHLKKGSSIGYGARFICPEDMPVGVIAMGYGDGYPRTAEDGTPILVNDVRCQIVGRISMDMATIDLRSCVHAKSGDPVVLWGEGLPVEEVAKHTSHIPYDLLCAVQSRVKFHWTIQTPLSRDWERGQG